MGGPRSGKTTLAEAMLFEGGVIERRGTVDAKNTMSDYHPIEHERLNSIKSTLLFAEKDDHKINIIDTPGFDDFIGELVAAMHVTEVGVLCLNAPNGIDVGAEIAWRHASNYNQPVILAANYMDHEKASFDDLLKDAREMMSKKIVPVQYPINSGADFDSIVDVLKMKLYKYPKDGGTPEILEIPESEMDRASELNNELVEAAAENDEQLMELFFDKGTLSEDEMREGIKLGLVQGDIFPLFCISAKNNIGVNRLMEFIIKSVPAPDEVAPFKDVKDNEIKCDSGAKSTAFVFKTSYEQHLGEVNFFKVISGKINEGGDYENLNTSTKEKLTQLFIMAGKKREKIASVSAGDIAAVIKLKNTKTNTTLAEKGINDPIKAIAFPEPKFRTAIKAVNSSEDEKLAAVLNKMHAEDKTLIFEYSKELKQMLLHGQGELHINIAKWHLDNEHKIETVFMPPKIQYRETITKESISSYRHKKQSGGAGQFGEVHMMVEPYEPNKPDPPSDKYNIRGKDEYPLSWGGKLIYYNAIVGGVIDARFMPAILKGIMEKLEEGPLTGSYARDIRVTVFDGKMHPVDSNEISFKLAGRNAFMTAFKQAGPKLLEPVYLVEVVVPEERMGDVMTDLQGRRAIILGMEGEGIYQRIKAKVPLAELNKYSTALSSLTNGRATYSMKFDEYAQVPPDIQEKLLKEYEESQKEEE